MKTEIQTNLMWCKSCIKNRSLSNTLDRFTDEYKNTKNYCEHYESEVIEMEHIACDYFDTIYRPKEVVPMEPCAVCGYYGNGHCEDGTTLCYECVLKLYR